jgi:hypothetical protein
LGSSFQQRLNTLIPWSSIAGIGNSTPARLTALAPLIGYLIIYNQFIADFFFLSKNGTSTNTESATILDLLRDLKLTFFYFGLVFFGTGAILFALFAPKSIRKYNTPEEYVLAMGAAQTEWLIVDSLTRVGRSAWKGDYFENPDSYGTTSLSFTEDTMYQLDAILEYAGHNAFVEETQTEETREPDPGFGFYNALGNVMTDRVLECILSKRRVDRALWHNTIGVIVDDRARDVFYMTYAFDEWSRFSARLWCAVMFVFGAALLVIPTFITSFEVVSQVGK